MVALSGGYAGEAMAPVHGFAHITGGGIPGKLGRVLQPSGLGAELGRLFAPCAAMTHCRAIGGIEDKEAYQTWNMGNGLLIITPEADRVIKLSESMGYEAMLSGRVDQRRSVRIRNRALGSTAHEWLTFDL
jgi:phosphoribosylformylglycinamidine cyclo-ligase